MYVTPFRLTTSDKYLPHIPQGEEFWFLEFVNFHDLIFHTISISTINSIYVLVSKMSEICPCVCVCVCVNYMHERECVCPLWSHVEARGPFPMFWSIIVYFKPLSELEAPSLGVLTRLPGSTLNTGHIGTYSLVFSLGARDVNWSIQTCRTSTVTHWSPSISFWVVLVQIHCKYS